MSWRSRNGVAQVTAETTGDNASTMHESNGALRERGMQSENWGGGFGQGDEDISFDPGQWEDEEIPFQRRRQEGRTAAGIEELQKISERLGKALGAWMTISREAPDWARRRGVPADANGAADLRHGRIWLRTGRAGAKTGAHEGAHLIQALTEALARDGDPAAKAAAAKFREAIDNAPETVKKTVRKRYGEISGAEVFSILFEEEQAGHLDGLVKGRHAKRGLSAWWERVKRLFSRLWQAVRRMLGRPLKLGDVASMDWPDAIHELNNAMRAGQRIVGENGRALDAAKGVRGGDGADVLFKQDGTGPTPEKPARKLDEKEANEYYAGRSLTEDAGVYSWGTLTSMPDMKPVNMAPKVDVLDENGRVSRKAIILSGMANAARIGYEKDGHVYVKNRYTGHELEIDRKSIRHGLGGGIARTIRNGRVGCVVGDIVKNAIPINALKVAEEADKNVVGTYAMACLVRGQYTTANGGQKTGDNIVIVTVEQRTNSVKKIDVFDVAHSLNTRNRRDLSASVRNQGLIPSTQVSANDATIADVLAIVKETHQSILSEDVLRHFNEKREPNGDFSNKVLFSVQEPSDTKTPEEETPAEEPVHAEKTYTKAGRRAYVVKDGVREYEDAELVKTGGWFKAKVVEGRKGKDGSARWSIIGGDGRTYVSGMKTEEDAKWALDQKRAEVAATLDMLRSARVPLGKVAEARRRLVEATEKLRNDAQGYAKALHDFMDKVGIPKDLQAKEAKFVADMMGAKSPWALERRSSQAMRFADTVLARMAIHRCRAEVEKLLKKHSGEARNPGDVLRDEAAGMRAARAAAMDGRSADEIDQRCEEILGRIEKIDSDLVDMDLGSAPDGRLRGRWSCQ